MKLSEAIERAKAILDRTEYRSRMDRFHVSIRVRENGAIDADLCLSEATRDALNLYGSGEGYYETDEKGFEHMLAQLETDVTSYLRRSKEIAAADIDVKS